MVQTVSYVLSLLVMTALASPAQTFTILTNFNTTDGSYPIDIGSLVQGVDGNLYGMTAAGGTSDLGIVFKITPGGALTTLYSLSAQNSDPYAGMILATDGNLYGTTLAGSGSIFKIMPDSTLATLYSFCAQSGCSDGGGPYAAPIQAADGNLYGTTAWSGTNGFGTVYRITLGGTLTTIYSFCALPGCADGSTTQAPLVQATNGALYGTTKTGGTYGSGTVFKITPDGALTTLYSFCARSGCADGHDPFAGLIQAADGALYGTTVAGGAYGRGTVFKITLAGTLTTLYSFCAQSGCADGRNPYSGLVQATNGLFMGQLLAVRVPSSKLLRAAR